MSTFSVAPLPMAQKWVKVNQEYHAAAKAKREAEGWQYSDTYEGATLPLVKGRRFRRFGKSGWYKFLGYTINPKGVEAIECFGPFTNKGEPKTGCGFGACSPEQVVKVARRVGQTEHEERVEQIVTDKKRRAA